MNCQGRTEDETAGQSSISLNSAAWVGEQTASSVSVHFRWAAMLTPSPVRRVLRRITSPPEPPWSYSSMDLASAEVVELAVALCASVVDRLLGLDTGRAGRLRRFRIGSCQLMEPGPGRVYPGSLEQLHGELGEEERHSLLQATLAHSWDTEQLQHFRFLESDGESKRIVVTAVR
jgi:hypothetical protein